MNTLKNGRDPFEPHAGIDAWTRQVTADLIGLLQMLHEDEIPDFNEAVPILVRRPGRASGDIGTVVPEDLGTGSAGAIRAHGPKIVFCGNTNDALIRKPGNALPQVVRFVVRVVNCGGKSLGIKGELLGDHGPSELNRAFLEIVAKAEIPEHFEEGQVSRGIPDIVEIVVFASGAHALLAAGCAWRRRCLDTRENVLERHHAGVHEHQGGIVVRHQRRRRHDLVLVGREEIEEGTADIVGRSHARRIRGQKPHRQAAMRV